MCCYGHSVIQGSGDVVEGIIVRRYLGKDIQSAIRIACCNYEQTLQLDAKVMKDVGDRGPPVVLGG